MKPLHLNLASRPYRDYGPFTMVASVALAVIAILAYLNIDTYLQYKSETKTTAGQIEAIERQIVDENARKEAANQRLRGIDVKLLAKQTQFANARLAERAFSWSELLDRLEHVVPNDVRIESISPSFSKEGLVHLNLLCVGKHGDSMTSTIDNLNRDPQFVGAFPATEQHGDVAYTFGISVDYRPSIVRVIE